MGIILQDSLKELTWAVISLILGVILSDWIKLKITQFNRMLKRKKKPVPKMDADYFCLGGKPTAFVAVEGDGKMIFDHDNISCKVLSGRPELPQPIEEQKEQYIMEVNKKIEEGQEEIWNGPLYGLKNFRTPRTTDFENPKVHLDFFETDYFTFKSTNIQLDKQLSTGRTIREEFLQISDFEKVVPFLANGFGIAFVIITEDENVVLTRRHSNTGARSNELDISVVEGVHPLLDRHNAIGPDLAKTVVRGAKEELGIILNPEQVQFLGFGVDMDYYQWNMIGFARVPYTIGEIEEIRSRGVSGKRENKNLEFINFNEKSIAEIILNEKMWSTAKVALYWTAKNQLDMKLLDQELKHSKLK